MGVSSLIFKINIIFTMNYNKKHILGAQKLQKQTPAIWPLPCLPGEITVFQLV
jgi:hypothetical protein